MYAKLITPDGNWDPGPPGFPCVSYGGMPTDASCTVGIIPK